MADKVNVNFDEITSELNKICEILNHTRDNTWGFRFDTLTDRAEEYHIRKIRFLLDDIQCSVNSYNKSIRQLEENIKDEKR